MRRKGQIKMTENMGILFIFFILIAMAFIFFMKFSRQSSALDIYEYRAQAAVKVSELISNLPEVRCSEDNVPKQDCFDWLRMHQAKALFDSNQQYYLNILSYSQMRVDVIYPPKMNFTVYDLKPGENCTTDFTCSYTPTFIPISIYDAIPDKYYFGILEVGLYEKT